jgi:hypothetical protein
MAEDVIANLPHPNHQAPDEETNIRDSEEIVDMVIELDPGHHKSATAEAPEGNHHNIVTAEISESSCC